MGAASTSILGTTPFTATPVEGHFSILKRGMEGIYQFWGKNHLHRYLAEFEFRYNNRIANGFKSADRFDELLKGVFGKGLTYQTNREA